MEPVSLGVGGLLLFAGWLLGRVSRRPSRAPKPNPVKLICTCGHGYGSHEGGKNCDAQIKRPSRWLHGAIVHYEWVTCPCHEYDGPEPLPRSFVLPELPTPKED